MKNLIGFTVAFATLILVCTAAPHDDTLPFARSEKNWRQTQRQNENIHNDSQNDFMYGDDITKQNQREQEQQRRQQPSLLSQFAATWQPIQEKMVNIKDDLFGKHDHKNHRNSENRKNMPEGEYRVYNSNDMINEDYDQTYQKQMSSVYNNNANRHNMNLKISAEDKDIHQSQYNRMKDLSQNQRLESTEQWIPRVYKSDPSQNLNMENSREVTKIQMQSHSDNESQPQNQRKMENKIRARNQKPVVETTGEELMNVVYKN